MTDFAPLLAGHSAESQENPGREGRIDERDHTPHSNPECDRYTMRALAGWATRTPASKESRSSKKEKRWGTKADVEKCGLWRTWMLCSPCTHICLTFPLWTNGAETQCQFACEVAVKELFQRHLSAPILWPANTKSCHCVFNRLFLSLSSVITQNLPRKPQIMRTGSGGGGKEKGWSERRWVIKKK